ncbi:MAG: efflux RND transporter periplasmic adaptor subunit [Opitutales bacterium]
MASLGILFALFGERFLPAARVQVETVVAVLEAAPEGGAPAGGERSSGADPFAAEVLFQASGWFEADPYSHRATALASGVVASVHVLEGESVEAGAPLATLIREDAELELAKAEAALAAARAAAATARSEHALSLAQEERTEREIAVARARREELADLAARATGLGSEVISAQEISQARLRLATQEETIAALGVQRRVREIETERWAGYLEQREAELGAARAELAEAELALSRQVVRAPVSGVVQRLLVAPGQKKILMADAPESATVAVLFEPARMQARVDVPLAEASRLFVGQAVLLESEFVPGVELRGQVTRLVGEADLQRNTLQAKIRIEEPPAGWRPEILCRAKFLAAGVGEAVLAEADSGSPSGAGAGEGGLRVYVPGGALFERAGRRAAVWALDDSGVRVEQRRLELGNAGRDGFVAVRAGLRPGDRVVLQPSAALRDGARVRY